MSSAQKDSAVEIHRKLCSRKLNRFVQNGLVKFCLHRSRSKRSYVLRDPISLFPSVPIFFLLKQQMTVLNFTFDFFVCIIFAFSTKIDPF